MEVRVQVCIFEVPGIRAPPPCLVLIIALPLIGILVFFLLLLLTTTARGAKGAHTSFSTQRIIAHVASPARMTSLCPRMRIRTPHLLKETWIPCRDIGVAG